MSKRIKKKEKEENKKKKKEKNRVIIISPQFSSCLRIFQGLPYSFFQPCAIR
jgi:hypothetical protein